MTQNFASIYSFHTTGSGQFLPPGQFYLSPVPIAIGMAKIAPYRLATGTLSLIATGTVNRMASPGNVYLLYCRAVGVHCNVTPQTSTTR
ncbi:MAG: hypothetical protein NT144_06700 [Bacteroidia bacterium]|nr:hypothetical protein [Bacteroidia bacterium]